MTRDNEWFEIRRTHHNPKEFAFVLCEDTVDDENRPATEEQVFMFCTFEHKTWMVEQLRNAANQLECMS